MRLKISNFDTGGKTENLWMSEFTVITITPDTITCAPMLGELVLPLTEDGVTYEGETYSDVAFFLPS